MRQIHDHQQTQTDKLKDKAHCTSVQVLSHGHSITGKSPLTFIHSKNADAMANILICNN